MTELNKKIKMLKWALTIGVFASAWGGFSYVGSAAAPSNLRLEAEDSIDICFGKNDAPLTIIEYSSLNCPHCAVFHNTIFPKLKEKYIDTGCVRLVFRHFPIDHKAFIAALVTACIPKGRRGRFVTAIFQNQSKYFGKDSDVRLSELAEIDKNEFKACITNQDVQDKVLNRRLAAEKVHKVDGAPTFFLEGKKYSGTLPLEEVEKVLNKKGISPKTIPKGFKNSDRRPRGEL